MIEVWVSFAISLSVVGLMLTLHACLVMFETSLVKFRYGDISPKVLARLKCHRWIAHLINRSGRTVRMIRFSKVVCTVTVGLFLTLIISDFVRLFGAEQAFGRWLVVLLSFVCATSIYFIFAEIVPRSLAIRDPAKGILYSYRVIWTFKILTFPLMLLFQRVKQIFFRFLGLELTDELNPLDVDVQIRAMGENASDLSPVARKIMSHTLKMQDLVVQDVLLPRNEVVICNLEEDLEANIKIMQDAGHTRYPLCHGNLDNCEGILHIKDIFRSSDSYSELDLMKVRRNVATFNLETSLEEALERMLRARFHMALVMGEFGEIVGVVTFESIIEELVGEIQDEFDREEAQIQPLDDSNKYRISGSTPIHDIKHMLGIEFDNDEVSTFSGLITGELGRIPKRNETLTVAGMHITVSEVNKRRVISAVVKQAEEV